MADRRIGGARTGIGRWSAGIAASVVAHALIVLALAWGVGQRQPEALREAPVPIRIVAKEGASRDPGSIAAAAATTTTTSTTTTTTTSTTMHANRSVRAARAAREREPDRDAETAAAVAGEATGARAEAGSGSGSGSGTGTGAGPGAGDGDAAQDVGTGGPGRGSGAGSDGTGMGGTASAADAPPDVSGLRRSYAMRVRKAIEDGSRYPPLARRRGWEGRVLVRLRIDERGRVVEPVLARRCDHDLLDEAALASARVLSDLPPPPGGPIEVLVPVEFRIRPE